MNLGNVEEVVASISALEESEGGPMPPKDVAALKAAVFRHEERLQRIQDFVQVESESTEMT